MSNPGKNKIQVRKQYIETLPPEVKLQDVAVPGGDQAGLLHCLNGTQWTLSLSWDLKLKRLKKKTAVTTMIQCFIVTNALAARATGVYVNRKWTQGLGWKTSIQQTMPTTREEVSFVNIYFIWRRKEQHGFTRNKKIKFEIFYCGKTFTSSSRENYYYFWKVTQYRNLKKSRR